MSIFSFRLKPFDSKDKIDLGWIITGLMSGKYQFACSAVTAYIHIYYVCVAGNTVLSDTMVSDNRLYRLNYFPIS